MTSDADKTRAFRAVVDDARAVLRRVGVVCVAAVAVTSLFAALLVALAVLVVAPFSEGLRAALLFGVAASVVVASAIAWRRRLSPLASDEVVARVIETALARLGHEARGDVVGAVELLDDDEGSRGLVLAHVAMVARTLEDARASDAILPAAFAAARRTLLALAVVVSTTLVVGLVGGEAVRARLLRLFDGDAARAAVLEAALHRPPLVVDLTLTLRFPAYMARAEQALVGASGDIVAPRGTEVFLTGRADHPTKGAAVVVGEREIALSVVDERALSGSFVVEEATTYRFRLTRASGAVELSPVARKITLEPDAAPEVVLTTPDADRVVNVDESVPLAFSAKDDFGVTAFRLVVVRQGSGAEGKRKDLLVVDDARRELAGKGSFRPNEVGGRPGDRLSVFIEALDNDTVSGPKAGRSVTRVLTVFSPAEHHRELIDRERALLDRMVDVLALGLENPVPRGQPSDDEKPRVVERQGELAKRSLELVLALDVLVADLVKDPLSPDEVRRALSNMRAELERSARGIESLVRGARGNIAVARPIPAYLFGQLRAQGDALTSSLERHVLYLDDLLNAQRLDEARALTDELSRTQQALKELLQKYKESPDDETRAAILSEIERLKEQMDALAARLSELESDMPDEHLNEEAFRADALMAETTDLSELVEEGKVDDAIAALEKMMEGTEKLKGDIEQSKSEFGGDEYKEMREKMRAFTDELSAVKAAQEELERRSERLLDAARKEATRRLERDQRAILDELLEKTRKASDALKKIDARGLFTPEQEEASYAEARVSDLLAALAGKDLDDALQAAREAEASTRETERQVSDRTRGRFSTANERTHQARDRLEEARPLLEEVRETLEKILPAPEDMLDDGQRAQMKKDAKTQGELKERAAKLLDQMRAMGEELPLFGPSHDAQVGEAASAMRDASQRLGREELREGRRAQARAMQALGGLEKALEEMGKGQGTGSGIPMPLPSSGSEGGRREEGDGRRQSDEEVEIPGAEDFQAPERFRREILEAMREDAPPAWSDEVKRYYEELIK